MKLPLPAAVVLLAGLTACAASPARADDPNLIASFGLSGKYRTGAWIPVAVRIAHPSGGTIQGQVQITGDPAYNGMAQNDGSAQFARPVTVAPAPTPQTVTVYVRGIDPGRQNITVRLVEGRARGDGAALATSVSNNNGVGPPPTVTGSALTDRDLFLVGLSADPSAFIGLGGQDWGLAHSDGGPMPLPASAAQNGGRASVVTAGPAMSDLPDRPAGYGGVDAVLIRADAPLDALSEAQADALRGWATGGGHLIVCGGPNPGPLSAGFYQNLLPAVVGGAKTVTLPGLGAASVLSLTPRPGARTLLWTPAHHPLVVDAPCGAGRVTLLAFDPTTPAAQAWNGPSEKAFWTTVMQPPSSILGALAYRQEGSRAGNYYGYGGQGQLTDAVINAPALDAPGAGVIGLFLAAYLIILVPLNYLILKRLDKKEWAWATVPGLVLVFALGTYGVGYASKGGGLFVNRATVLETTTGQRRAGVISAIGIFSPRRAAYDLALNDSTALAAIPETGEEYGRQRVRDDGQTRFVQPPDGTAIQDAAVNMWAMRAFDVQTTTDLGGAFTSALVLGPGNGRISGSVANGTAHGLTGCALYCRGGWTSLPDLPPGGRTPINAITPVGANLPNTFPNMPISFGAPNTADVSGRMKTALGGLIQNLGNDPTNGGNNYYYNGAVPAWFAPHADEAILVGWSDEAALAGPPVLVDGHAQKQNDVSLVVVHLPLSPAPGP